MASSTQTSPNGQMEIMDYNFNDIQFSKAEVEEYQKNVVNKIFAVLGIYEDCQSKSDFESYYAYLGRLCTELNGLYQMFGSKVFLSVASVLCGMKEDDAPTHSTVKSLVFHCISVVKKVG